MPDSECQYAPLLQARAPPALPMRPPRSPALLTVEPSELFTKEPEGTACLREPSRTPSPSHSAAPSPAYRRRLPPTPRTPSLLGPALPPPVLQGAAPPPLQLQINFPR